MKPAEWPQECIETLRTTRPNVHIEISRTLDPSFVWDGDGPDPEEEGYQAYDVGVSAICVVDGNLYEGKASLGGSYYQHDEPLGDIHGYLPQMVEEAVKELDESLRAVNGIGLEVANGAHTHCSHCGMDLNVGHIDGCPQGTP